MKILVKVNRKSAILGGGEDGYRLVQVNTSLLSEAQRQTLAKIDPDATLTDRPWAGTALNMGSHVGTDQADIAARLDEIATDVAAEQAADLAAHAAAVVRAAEQVAQILLLSDEEFRAIRTSGLQTDSLILADPAYQARLDDVTLRTASAEIRARNAQHLGYYSGGGRWNTPYSHVTLAANRETPAALAYREAYAEYASNHERWQQEDRAATEAAAEKKRLAAEAAETARSQQIAIWVAARGTASQQARLAVGLLPEAEVLAAIEEEAYTVLGSYPRYNLLKAEDVCRCDYSTCHVDYRSYPATEATADEFQTLVELRKLLPGAEVALREHEGTSTDCENTVVRRSVRVTVIVGALKFARSYSA